jgi:type II secretory pathway component GspD/PulD (secretin)
MLWSKIRIALVGVVVMGTLGLAGGLVTRQAPGPAVTAAQPQTVRGQTGTPAPAEKTWSFELRNKPWSSVLEWYSDISGLPFVGKHRPRGTATFIPPKNKRQYTLGEITDILNELLVAQDYILVRRTASFTVLPADEKIDLSLLPRVRVEDLKKRGRTELVTLVVTLKTHNAANVASQVKKLMGKFGAVVVLERTNQLVLQDTAGTLRQIQRTIQGLDDTKRAPAKSLERRLDEVEKQLADLLDEVKRLRQDVKDRKKAGH